MNEMIQIDSKTLLTLAIKAHVLDAQTIAKLEAELVQAKARIQELEAAALKV